MNMIKIEGLYLKPCPFCGGEAGFIEAQWDFRSNDIQSRIKVEVGCAYCATMKFECDSLSEAAARWNRRDETKYYGQTVESEEMLTHEQRCVHVCNTLMEDGLLQMKVGRKWNRYSFGWMLKAGKIDEHEFYLSGGTDES